MTISHFGKNANLHPQGDFDSLLLTPVIRSIEEAQHFLASQIAESEPIESVALLLCMVIERAILYQRDVNEGEPNVERTSVNILSKEKYVRMKALCPHISPSTNLPYMVDTPENRKLVSIFVKFIDEFLVRYGKRKPSSPYNIRLQDIPGGADLNKHIDMLTQEKRVAGIHLRGVWSIGGEAKVSFQGHKKTHTTLDDDVGPFMEGIRYGVNSTSAHYYQTSIWSHGSIQLCYDNKERTEGIQMYHKVFPVQAARSSVVLDWVVDTEEDAGIAMMNVKKNSKIGMSKKLHIVFNEFISELNAKV